MATTTNPIFNTNFFGGSKKLFQQKTVGDSPVFSFETAMYIATQSYLKEMSRVQAEMIGPNQAVTLPTGEELHVDKLGDTLGIKLYLDLANSVKTAFRNMSTRGLEGEIKALTS